MIDKEINGITDAIAKAIGNGYDALVVVNAVLTSGVTNKKKIVDEDDEYSSSRVENTCKEVDVVNVETDDKNTWAFLLRKNMVGKEERKESERVFNTSVKAWLAMYKKKIELKISVNEDNLLRLVFFRTENAIFKVNGIPARALIDLVEDNKLDSQCVYRAIREYNRLV